MCVTWVFARRWGLWVHGDSRRRGQQSHRLWQLETSEFLSATHFCHFLLLISYSLDWFPVFSCSTELFLPKPSLTSRFDTLPLHLRNFLSTSHLSNFSDGPIICVHSSVKRVFVPQYGESCRSGCAHCSLQICEIGKTEIALLLPFLVSIQTYSEQEHFDEG